MLDKETSALVAMRQLRDDLSARLEENEDYRAWRALDQGPS
jgi:hypothetical protein